MSPASRTGATWTSATRLNLYVFYRMSDRMSGSAKLRAGSNTPAPGYFAERNGTYVISTERNALRLPTDARLDLRASRTFNWPRHRLTLFAEVMNVVNRSTAQVSRLFEPLIPTVPSAGIQSEW